MHLKMSSGSLSNGLFWFAVALGFERLSGSKAMGLHSRLESESCSEGDGGAISRRVNRLIEWPNGMWKGLSRVDCKGKEQPVAPAEKGSYRCSPSSSSVVVESERQGRAEALRCCGGDARRFERRHWVAPNFRLDTFFHPSTAFSPPTKLSQPFLDPSAPSPIRLLFTTNKDWLAPSA